MGIFSQDKTTTNQTAYNQQVGVSSRDVGQQVTGAAGANTAGLIAVGPGLKGNITVSSLDNAALQTAAFTINHALDTNAAFAQSALQSFQNATTVSAEHSTGGESPGLSPTTTVDGQTTLASVQPHHIDYVMWGALVLIGGFIAYNYFKHHR